MENLSNDRYLQEVRQKCAILCLDTPQFLDFGVDLFQWKCGPNFKGVKLIPPGPHFIHYSGGGKHDGGAPKTGFFVYLKSSEVVVRKWNTETEDFDTIPKDEEERYIQGVQKFEFDQYLGPYPMEENRNWFPLANFISESLISRLSPLDNRISGIYDVNEESGKVNTDQQKLKHKPYYSTIARVEKKKGATASELTNLNMDRSQVLLDIIEKRYKDRPSDIVGELQFSFICFMLAESYDSFEQWKQITHLLCSCEVAMTKFPILFSQFIEALQAQLQQAPIDFFSDALSSHNFLEHVISNLLQLLQDVEDKKLQAKREGLKNFLEKRFGRKFLEAILIGNDEDAPVVVDDNQT